MVVGKETKKPTAKPAVAAKSVAKPVTKKSAKPGDKKSAKPAAKKSAKPAAKVSSKSVAKKASKVAGGKKQKRPVPILSGKYVAPNTIKTPRTLFLTNLAKTTTPTDVKEMLIFYKRYIKSVRMLVSRSGGKKATKKDGKVVPAKKGGAFVTFKCPQKMKECMKKKNLSIQGREVKVELAKVKRAHVKLMTEQVQRKKDAFKKHQEAKVAIKAEMKKNLDHNSKPGNARKIKYELKKKSIVRPLKEGEKRKTTFKDRSNRRQERAPLSGFNARKAMARRTRK